MAGTYLACCRFIVANEKYINVYVEAHTKWNVECPGPHTGKSGKITLENC